MERKDYGDLMRQMHKDIERETKELRVKHAPAPYLSMRSIKVWMTRIAMAGLAIGIIMNEVWPRAKKHFKL